METSIRAPHLSLWGLPVVSAIGLCILLGLAGCAAISAEPRDQPFFGQEYGLATHGRKTWFDHLVEVDPGRIKTRLAPDYEKVAPEKIAVLPFGDLGTAEYVVDKIPLTHRSADKRVDWAWTDANRLRRAVLGYLSEREFLVANSIQVDAILRIHGIDSEKKLGQVSPQTLGTWLGVDAVVYGDVTHYEAYYAFLMSAWQVGCDLRIVSAHDGRELFGAEGSRYSVDLRPAFDPMDIAINSGLALLELRDVTLARAEEETAREIVLRIPRSKELENRLIEEAWDRSEYANDVGHR